MARNLKNILSRFNISGQYVNSKPFGSGHINETYLVIYLRDGAEVKYVLRKINQFVFKEPEILIRNTVNVINHIKQKLLRENAEDINRKVLTLIQTKDNKNFYLNNNSDYWCLFYFIGEAYTVDYVQSLDQAFEAAKAFGRFQRYLIDADIQRFKPTIPDFHNLPKRLIAFEEAVKSDVSNRVSSVRSELNVIENFRYINEKVTELVKKWQLPLRITHNDTKINNVMLDNKTGEGLCVLDLDTVMPGTVLNDFGDMVRTFTSPVGEDDKDLSKISVRLDVFEVLVKGFLGELKDVLTESETLNLVLGAKLIVYEQSIRFLTDYLSGDVYYNTEYEKHNLVRTKNQLALLESLEELTPQLERIVKKYSQPQ